MFVAPTLFPNNQMYPQQQMMQQPVVQQANLPFPANAFVTAPQQPNIANPIFQQALSNDQGIAPYSQMISWSLANEIVTRAAHAANNNAIRIFGYNLYSNNQFNNNEFLELARLIAERVRIAMIRGEAQSVEQAIQVLVTDTYTLACGANLRRFDGLGAFITNQVANDCMGAAQAIDRIYNEIAGLNNLSKQSQMAGVGVMVNNNNNNQMVNNQMMNQQNNQPFTNFNPAPNAISQVSPTVAVLAGKQQSELTAMERQLLSLNSEPQQQVAQQQQQQVVSSKNPLAASYMSNPTVHNPNQVNNNTTPGVVHYGANAPEYNVSQSEFDRQVEQAKNEIIQPMPEVNVEPVAKKATFSRDDIAACPEDLNDLKVSIEEHPNGDKYHFMIDGKRYDMDKLATYGGDVVWAPSALQPFHPLVCLNYQRLAYVKLVDGTVLAIVQELSEGDWHMDYDKHSVGSGYSNKPPIVPHTKKPVEKPTYTDVLPAGMVIGRYSSTDQLGTEQAVTEAYLTSVADMLTDGTKNALVAESRLVTPIVARTNEEALAMFDALKNIVNARSFSNAAESISNIKNIGVRDLVNQYVTDRVNDVVRFELSMDGDPITNFMADHRDLLDVIKTNFAGAVSETIVSYQGRIISSAFDVVKSTDVPDAHMYFGDVDSLTSEQEIGRTNLIEGLLGKTLFLTRNLSVTVVNLYSEDLALYLDKQSCAVLENKHPQLREIIEQALTNTNVKNAKPAMRKSILMSLDGIKWEVAKSLTQNSAYLIRKL